MTGYGQRGSFEIGKREVKLINSMILFPALFEIRGLLREKNANVKTTDRGFVMAHRSVYFRWFVFKVKLTSR